MARSKQHQYPDDALRWEIAQITREEGFRPLTGHERNRRQTAQAILDKRQRNRAKKEEVRRGAGAVAQ